MLSIISAKDGSISAICHTGQPLPYENIRDVGGIEADGDELEEILAEFDNIPKTKQPVQIWLGEMARYIYANLGLIRRRARILKLSNATAVEAFNGIMEIAKEVK